MQKMDKTGRSRGLFSRGIPLLALLGVVVFMAAMPGSVHGQVDTMNIKPKPPASNWSEVVGGWEEFSGPYYLLDISLILLISIILAAVIAYHPSTRRKASNIT
ncbi:MAG: hypothetical protein VX288_08295, partial [Planctomycetota bacterium]|nr:hypothetical protein [Planctomycetota bacterium]